MSGENVAVRMLQGGETLEVASGGQISVKSGGKITNDGTQASNIPTLATSPAASNAEIATAVNAIIAALEGAGVTAGS